MKTQVQAAVIVGFVLAVTACTPVDMPTETQVLPSTVSAAVEPTCGALPPLHLPRPRLSGLDVSTAAPGVTIRVFGVDLNPKCAYAGPKVIFDGGRSSYYRRSAQVIGNSELRVVVPPASGTVKLRVETAGGSTSNLSFTYKKPVITGSSPASGLRGAMVTITGHGFGFNSGSLNYVKFGNSPVVPHDWKDTRITVRAPSDFGTGNNKDIVLSSTGCIGNVLGGGLLLKTLPGCKDLWASLVRAYQLNTSPGFVQKEVSVIVFTPAGRSGAASFTYRVPLRSQ